MDFVGPLITDNMYLGKQITFPGKLEHFEEDRVWREMGERRRKGTRSLKAEG